MSKNDPEIVRLAGQHVLELFTSADAPLIYHGYKRSRALVDDCKEIAMSAKPILTHPRVATTVVAAVLSAFIAIGLLSAVAGLAGARPSVVVRGAARSHRARYQPDAGAGVDAARR